MIIYDKVAKEVGPKKEQLAQAQSELVAATELLATKQAELKEVLDNVAQLEADFESAVQKQQDLEFKSEQCKSRLERAEKLISNLGGEQERWAVASQKRGVAYDNLTGDILVSAGVIAYLGVFTSAYRKEATDAWVAGLKAVNIAAADEYSLSETIGESVKIRQCTIDKLPNDAISTENAIILYNSRRWPLMIDPQVQANKWIKNTYGNSDLKVLRLTKSDYGRQLESAIQFGFPVLIENILEVLDPMLEPLLQKAFYKAGSLLMIKLGDATLEYSPNFKLFLTTKLANPHYPPEVCVTVCLLNFVTTAEGLSDQLLAKLVAKDFPEMEQKRIQLIVDSARSKAELKSIEDQILYLLANSTGNILDDEVLISTLANSKVKSVKIEESVAVQERTQREIVELRKNQVPVADRSASLFFVVSDMQTIEPMYQYSLEWFIGIYLNAIDTAEKAKGAQRLKNLNEKFISLLFGNVCRSLFEKDKLLFSILLTLKMLYFDNEADAEALNLFFTGGGGAGAHTLPKPTGEGLDWLTDTMRGKMLEFEKLHEPRGEGAAFYNFCTNFDAQAWTKVFDANDPISSAWPGDMHLKCATVEKALVLLAIRPDALVAIQQALVIEKLGPAFLEPPPFNVEVEKEIS